MAPVFVACSQCGFENDPQHHFCGMCGEPLRAPYAAPTPPTRPVPGISGPSILGLGGEEPASRSVDYLLEEADEPPSRRGFVYLVLLLVLGVVAVGAWRWRQSGYPWDARLGGHPANENVTTPASAPASPSAPADSTAPSAIEVNPANPAANSTQPPAPATPPPPTATTDATAPAAPATTASAPAADHAQSGSPSDEAKQADAKPATPKAAEPSTSETSSAGPKSVAPTSAEPASAEPKAAAPAKRAAQTASKADDSADDDEEEADVEPVQPRSVQPRKAAKPSPNPSERATPVDPTAAWVIDGQKYLYGNGVPQDCRRAKAQMLAAAARSNPEAQSTLGTMYATGHCVDRDVISAYRWFAQALQKDPSNTRIQEDLKVLWNEMTPQERQAAVQSKR
ncbi:MAG TPA: hypothetical protein VMH85_00635 [Terriglobales bacterium]|nr:hypothetical protein [Terriglobales bacterium]